MLVSNNEHKHCTADIGDFGHRQTTDIILFTEKYFETKHEMGSKKMGFFPYSKKPSSDILIWTVYCITENFSIEGMVNYESEAAE
jgi:hypothetical protein